MKNLNIAGTVSSSQIVDVNGKEYLEINVALNHTTPAEWIKVMSTNTALTIEKGSRFAASGNPVESAYIDKKDNKAKISRTLWASFSEVIYSPSSAQETQATESPVQNETKAEPISTPKASASAPVEENLSPLELAYTKIDGAKTAKQLGFIFYNFVNVLDNEEDKELAQQALNSRKKELEKKAA